MLDIFSAPWAARCAEAIRASTAYRAAAAAWEGDLVFRINRTAPAEARAVYLDLWHGECRSVRPATTEDQSTARYLIEGDQEAWQQVFEGKLVPLLALMTGRLKLARGRVADLAPYAASAKELLALMSGIGGRFPE
jgi:putative sterol carrier protein